ncbi:MAG: MFS transporter, partial [Planctomycetaceae bacterium]
MQSILRAAGYSLLVTWMVYLLENAFSLDKQTAGTMNMYPLIGVVLGSLSGGIVVDLLLKLTGSKRLSRSGLAVVVLGLCGVFTVLAARETGSIGFVNLMSVAAFFFGLSQPAAWSATLDVAGRNTSVVMGTMNMAGCIGAFWLPVGVGYLIDWIEASGGDWNLVIYLTAAVHFAAAVSWLFVNPNDTTIIGDQT